MPQLAALQRAFNVLRLIADEASSTAATAASLELDRGNSVLRKLSNTFDVLANVSINVWKCQMQKGATRHAQQAKRPLHAASGNVVNHIPTLSHTHTHTHLHTHLHTFLWAATQRTFRTARGMATLPPPPLSHHKRCRWRRWAWQTVCCCCCCVSFYIIFCYFAMRSKCGFYVFVYGKIRQMAFTPLSLSFSLSRTLSATAARCQRLQLWSLHTICSGRVASAPQTTSN